MSLRVSFPLPQTRAALFIDGYFLEKYVKDNFKDQFLSLPQFIGQVPYAPCIDVRLSGMDYPSSKIIRTYYYDALPDFQTRLSKYTRAKVNKRLKFLNNLEEKTTNIEVRKGFVKYNGNGKSRQKGVDTMLASDMVSRAMNGKIEQIILVAGDGDFVPAVQMAKDLMVNVFLLTSDRVSMELKRSADVCNSNIRNFIETHDMLYGLEQAGKDGMLPIL